MSAHGPRGGWSAEEAQYRPFVPGAARDTTGGAWLPSGTYTGELRVGAFPAELVVSLDTALPEAYHAAAKAMLEAKVGRSLADEEVPATVPRPAVGDGLRAGPAAGTAGIVAR